MSDDEVCSPGAGVTAGAGCVSGRHCGGWSVVPMVSSDGSVSSGYFVNMYLSGRLSSPTVLTPWPDRTWSPVVAEWRPSTGPAPTPPPRGEDCPACPRPCLMAPPSPPRGSESHVNVKHTDNDVNVSGPPL